MTNYNINQTNLYTNDYMLKQLGKRVEQLRIRRNITQADLAKEAGIGKRTLERFEHGQSVQLTSFIAIIRQLGFLEELLNCVPDQSISPMAQLLAEKQVRYRASKKTKAKPDKEWVWPEDEE